MESFSFEPIEEPVVMSALQGPGTNALVTNPFAFEDVQEPVVMSALQGVGTNALVANPFAWAH
ncbi:streptamidine-related RiPP repeat protein [Cryptosporangium arvum]|uniref:Uncharacterized protein n=1 Tax=Cryptosporangium arvum DSM 44712 TaxID=927661 RepID=A0A010YZ46_9ACTN|nr:streptamidine-related RiPP repeat protein [Cryptosporangium arvum]EXG80498.1 hypothetical protein CryarDRAFT_1576 [Cryptosporangium arvum DSM 44712]